MPEKTELTIEQIHSAVTLSAEPTAGATVRVKRAGKSNAIPIQLLHNLLRAEYPDTKFVFGEARPEPETQNPKP